MGEKQDEEWLLFLSDHRPPTVPALFPRLRSFQWYSPSDGIAKHTEVLLGPQLTSITLRGSDRATALILREFGEHHRGPPLHHLDLRPETYSFKEYRAAAYGILYKSLNSNSTFHGLHEVVLGVVPDIIVASLAPCPRLRVFRAQGIVDSLKTSTNMPSSLCRGAYPLLQDLEVSGGPISDSMVELCKIATLKTFTLGNGRFASRQRVTAAQLERLFEALGTHSSLRDIVIACTLENYRELVDLRIFQGLSGCPLRSLKLDKISCDIRDSLRFHQLLEHWPLLEELRLHQCKISPHTLYDIAMCCPSLHTINVWLKIASLDEDDLLEEQPRPKCSSLKIVILDPAERTIQEPAVIAAVLSGLFACATFEGEGWGKVVSLLNLFRAARAQELRQSQAPVAVRLLMSSTRVISTSEPSLIQVQN